MGSAVWQSPGGTLNLRTEWPGLNNQLGQCVGMCSQPLVVCSVCTALSGDSDSGEKEMAGPSHEAPQASVIHSTEDFSLEQPRDGTLLYTQPLTK